MIKSCFRIVSFWAAPLMIIAACSSKPQELDDRLSSRKRTKSVNQADEENRDVYPRSNSQREKSQGNDSDDSDEKERDDRDEKERDGLEDQENEDSQGPDNQILDDVQGDDDESDAKQVMNDDDEEEISKDMVLDPGDCKAKIGPDGIKQLFPDSANNRQTWYANWTKKRTMKKVKELDPFDKNASMRGTGSLVIGDGVLTMSGEYPRYYVKTSGPKWQDVEMTAYARNEDGAAGKFFSGITLATRSNHHNYDNEKCEARGYYARLWFQEREIGIQKEFWHSADPKGTLYSESVRSKTKIPAAAYQDKFLGFKFVVRTLKNKSVKLQIYLDYTNGKNGGDWKKSFEYIDKDLAAIGIDETNKRSFPCEYPYAVKNGMESYKSPVLDGGMVSLFRTDGVKMYKLTKASVRNIEAEANACN